MNINSNELSILKKIKFAAEPTEESNTGVALKLRDNENQNPETTATSLTDTPEITEASMNKLMFQGLKNVVSDPQLAQETGGLNNVETQPKEEGGEKEYVAPFKSNLAFQGKAGKLKTYVAAAMMGLASLGAVTTLQSCEEVDMTQTVTVDMEAITTLIAQLTSLFNEMKEQQTITNQQLQQMNAYMLELMEEVRNGNINAEQFYQKMFDYMIVNGANQKIIIDQLVQNGMKQDEANQLIRDLISEVQSGKISAEEAMKIIQDLLGDIKGLLGQIISDLKEYADRASEERQNLIDTNKKGFEELIKRGDITNETLKNMEAQNDSMIVLSNKQIEAQEKIKAAIEKANMDSNANFETVVKTLNANKNELISALMRLGYTQAQILKMTAGEIIKAIDKNTEVTKEGNALLLRITKQLMILPKLYQQGVITNIQLNEFYKLYQEATADGAEFNAEVLAKLEELASKLDGIQMSLDQVLDKLEEHFKNDREVLVYLKKINNNLKENNDKTDSTNEVLNLVYKLVEKNGKDADALGKQILNYIAAFGFETNQNFKKVLAAINTGNKGSEDIKALLEKVLANQNKNTKAIIDAIGNIEINGGGSVDLSSLERMVAELLAQAKKNGNILSQINAKQDLLNSTTKSILDNLEKEFGKNDVRYENINNILNVIANKTDGKDDQELLDKLDKVLAKMDEIKDAIKNHKVEVDISGKITCECNCGNHEGILGDLEDILDTKAGTRAHAMNGVQHNTYFAPQWAEFYGFNNRA